MIRLVVPGGCRECGEPAFMADETGPAHPCCLMHPGERCPACAISKAYRGNFYSKQARDQEAKR